MYWLTLQLSQNLQVKFHCYNNGKNYMGRESITCCLWFNSVLSYSTACSAALGLTACVPNEVWFLPTPHCFGGVSRVEVHRLRLTHTHAVTHEPLLLSLPCLTVQRVWAVLLSFTSFIYMKIPQKTLCERVWRDTDIKKKIFFFSFLLSHLHTCYRLVC